MLRLMIYLSTNIWYQGSICVCRLLGLRAGERPPAEDFPPRLDVVPELDTRGALTRLWDHLKKGQKQRLVADAIAEFVAAPVP